MNVTFLCRHCEQPARFELDATTREIPCPACQAVYPVTERSLAADGRLKECLVCGCQELFVRKDFSQSSSDGTVTSACFEYA